jgi:DNA-directed RNA polymerase subunit RPC12/RpoP
MNLHELNRVEPEEEEDEEIPDIPTCHDCGSNRFYREHSGTFTEFCYLTFSPERDWPTEDWNGMDQETHDQGPWHCTNCDTEVDRNTSDMINDRT